MFDLSFLDAHQVCYRHEKPDRPTITYEFLVTYSFHCFAKDYDSLHPDLRRELMYHAPRESQPFVVFGITWRELICAWSLPI